MVRKVAEKVFIPFTVGGGIRTVDDFKALLREGADKISINSSAINTPRLISDAADKFGSQCVVVAIDARRRADGSGWNVYKNGGRIDTGLDAIEWAVKANELGAGEILLTSMDCDGTRMATISSLQGLLPIMFLFRLSHRAVQAQRSILRGSDRRKSGRSACSFTFPLQGA